MQYAKDEIRQRIINVAREEFLDKGFEKSSIRMIATNAETSKSNLYNYFENKDELFRRVLDPTVSKIRKGLEFAKQYNVPKETEDYTLSSQQFVIGVISNFIAQNTDDVKLLLFKAQGSTLECFKYEVLDAFTDNMIEWTQSIRTEKKVSRLFVRTVCSFYLNMIEQLFLVGPSEDIEKYMNELSVFIYHGWKNVLAGK